MKFALSVLAVLAMVSSMNASDVYLKVPSTGSGALAKEIQDFMNLIPADRVSAIFRAYAAQDKEFQSVLKIVDSEETVLFVEELEAHPAVKDVFNYMQNAGLDIYSIVNKAKEIFGRERITPVATQKITGGLRGLCTDVVAIVSVPQLQDLFDSKRKQSPVFAALHDEINSPKYNELYRLVFFTNTHLGNIVQQATEADLEIDAIDKTYVYWIIAGQVPKLHL